jgi:hypothetical protein
MVKIIYKYWHLFLSESSIELYHFQPKQSRWTVPLNLGRLFWKDDRLPSLLYCLIFFIAHSTAVLFEPAATCFKVYECEGAGMEYIVSEMGKDVHTVMCKEIVDCHCCPVTEISATASLVTVHFFFDQPVVCCIGRKTCRGIW